MHVYCVMKDAPMSDLCGHDDEDDDDLSSCLLVAAYNRTTPAARCGS